MALLLRVVIVVAALTAFMASLLSHDVERPLYGILGVCWLMLAKLEER